MFTHYQIITNFWVNRNKLVGFHFFWAVLIYLTLFVGDQEVASSGSLFFTEQKEKGLSVSQAGFSIHVAL